MTTDQSAEQQAGDAENHVEDLLASPELARAVETDEFKDFLDHLPIAVVVARIAGNHQRIVFANRAFERLTGQPFARIEGKGWSILDQLVHEDDARMALGRAVLAGEDILGTFRHQSASGNPVLVQAYTSVVEDELNGRHYRIVALVDVSERERSQREEFERQIRDRDLLLKELQHRVKNNLQLLVALIRLEARGAQRGDPVNLDRLQGRIHSLHLLYDALSLAPSANEVDLGQYLAQIAGAAMRSHADDGVRLDLKVNQCPVSVNIAMPIGLVVNELLTNAFKYAFQGRANGTIEVQCLHEGGSQYRIVVADDGVGLPPGTRWPGPGKLSAFILQTLCENSELKLDVASSPGAGTRVTLAFAYRAPGRKAN